MILTEKTAKVKQTSLTPDKDSFRMRVPVLKADEVNSNRRRYPFAVVKAAIDELKTKLQKRASAYGSTRHEDQLEVDSISHLIEDVEMDKDGTAYATLRILPTQRGKNLSAIIKNGGRLGVSARGAGDVKEGVVQAGYRLLGLDFCLDPSFGFTAGKEAMVFESRSEENDLVEKELSEDKIKERFQFALKSGYRGTLEQYSKDVLMKKS